MALARFMASPAGRLLRIAVGLVLGVIGLAWVGGVGGTVLALVGVVPVLAGAFNVCLLGPLFGAPFKGASLLTPHASK